jgi:AraC family transcriptional regulator of adaptative response/methylated-DNA-[protein]-cysteine methyltransferase
MSCTLTETFLSDSQRWQAVVERNPKADGLFLYAVQTTGVYCRPTCPSRLPNRDNILFFATCDEAQQAGFRSCKRCQPNTVSPHLTQVQTITRICKVIEESEEPILLQALADRAGLSPYHFHRLFKKIVGVTPKEYAIAHRSKRVRQKLNQENTVTQAIYEAGFEASSSFYDKATAILGMTPTDYRKGGSGIEIRFAVKPCWLGWILVAATPQGICAIAFDDTPDTLIAQLHDRFPNAIFQSGDPTFEEWIEQVLMFIEAPQQGLTLPLDIRGTVFQQQVWKALQTIPAGHTASYADIAREIGNPKAVRAVAQACASNQLAVAIPCHRVIASNGELSGYRWGQERKRALLNREAQ